MCMSRFPDSFPPDFEEKILRDKGEFVAHQGYRLAKYGATDPRSYLSTYEENIYNGRLYPEGDKRLKRDGTYSTSLFDNLDYLQYKKEFVWMPPPGAVIVEGTTDPSCGPSRVGPLREEEGQQFHHISWWIYKDTSPWVYFEEVKEESIEENEEERREEE